MADKKISDLTAATSLSSDDLVPVVDDPGGSPATKKITFANFVASISSIAALAVATLSISGVLTLSAQSSGRILYTESGGVATTTPNLAYTSTTQTLTTGSFVASSSSTLQGLNFANATGSRLKIGDGTAALPAIYFSNAGYGIYFSSNQIFFAGFGSENLLGIRTANILFYKPIVPSSTNSGDIGTTALAWKDIYVAGSLVSSSTTPLKMGRRSNTTISYYGTADGCQAEIRSTSTSAPTYSATSTSFCN